MSLLRAAAAVGLAAVTAAAATSCVASNRPATGNTSGRTPVVFVHGYTMQNSGMWSIARTQFVASGWRNGDLTEFNYNSTIEGAEASSRKLGDVVTRVAAQSPNGKVDIVAHSEGNLVTQACFTLGSCAGKIDHWVNMAGAQNGTALASAVIVGGGGAADMNPFSLLVTRLNRTEKQVVAEQGIKSIVFYTLTDGVIFPGDLPKEDYARNVPFLGTHLTVYVDVSVIAQSINFLKG